MTRRAAVGWLFALALAIRLAAALGLVALDRYDGDVNYRRTAERVVAGEGYFIETRELFDGLDPERTGVIDRFRSSRAPLYPLLLAAVIWMFGSGILPMLLLHASVAALVPPLVYLIGRRLFDRRTATIGALIVTVYPYSVMHDVRPFETGLFEALLAALVLLLFRLTERHDRTTAAATGLVLGATILVKSFFIAFPAVIAVWLVLVSRAAPRAAVRSLGIVAVTSALVLAPWIARNYRIHGALVPTTTYGGWVFYLGNNAWTTDLNAEGLELDGYGSARLNESGTDLAGLSEVQVDRYFLDRGRAFILADPGAAVARSLGKAIILWSPRLHPRGSQGAAVHAASYGLLLLLALAGLVVSRPTAARAWLLYGLAAYVTLIYSVFTSMSRYRKPLDAYLALFAAAAIVWTIDRVRGGADGTPAVRPQAGSAPAASPSDS